MNKLSHTDDQGHARMVDVSQKDIVFRSAKASGFIRINSETLKLVKENTLKKGDVLSVSEFAGIQAAKNTYGLIPLSHNIPLDHVSVITSIDENGIRVTGEVKCTGKTGVEMEALTAVSIALLTIYDMCKSTDRNMHIEMIRLEEKQKSTIHV
jgi:cyclic pyranopterin phosphate synthase